MFLREIAFEFYALLIVRNEPTEKYFENNCLSV